MIDAQQIRLRANWSQKRMAEYLGCDQATVSRIENGQEPSGPISRLLEILVRDLDQQEAGDRPGAPEQAGHRVSLGGTAA